MLYSTASLILAVSGIEDEMGKESIILCSFHHDPLTYLCAVKKSCVYRSHILNISI